MGVPVSEAVGVDLARSGVDVCSVGDVCSPCVAPMLAACELYKVCVLVTALGVFGSNCSFMWGGVTCRVVFVCVSLPLSP